MKNICLLWFVMLLAGFSQGVNAQNISNEGSDFWLSFPTHDPSQGELANMNVFVTCKVTSEVMVSCGTYSETKPIPANTIVTFSVPRGVSYISNTEGNATLTNRGIHAVVTAGKPNVAIYAHIYAGARSAASLILPKEALGQKYYSMNYTQDNGGRNFLVLVAVEDNTNLIIHTSPTTTKRVSLPKAGDVYEYYPPGGVDLTGTFVEVDPSNSLCKRFAAFSGSTSLIISCSSSRDPLFQQLYTVSSWGKNYGIVPFIGRRYILRILAQEDNTNINVNGTTVRINKGAFYETSQLTDAGIVTADKLISVAQYSLTQGCSSISGGSIIGDPDMVLLNPTEFNIKNITVFSSSKQAITNKYINVFMKTAKTNSFKLNGALPANGSWKPVPSVPDYSFIQIEVFVESLTLTADDGFNAIAYGFGGFESYAYSAGTNLASSQFLTLLNKSTNKENSAACVGQAADFKLTLAYPVTKLIWKFSDGTPDYPDYMPAPVVNVVNGETLYTYTVPVNKTFNVPGQTQISAIATLATSAGSCAESEVELVFNFAVDPLPTALFTLAPIGCSAKEISFKDESKSNVNDKVISGWVWDFGDNSPISYEQNPKHTYTTIGNFTVKLTVLAENGCASNVEMHDIFISPKPIALFSLSSTTCVNAQISFVSQSSVAQGTILKQTWDFGDPTSTSNSSLISNPFHVYSTAGSYKVKLIVETDKGCLDSLIKLITIHELPKTDFIIPDVCLADAQAVFLNKATDYDGSISNLTYMWDFGDPLSGALNSSTVKDGAHKYNASGNYTVTLTVTNGNGCKVTASKPFTVNGSFPKASYDVINPNNLCSNKTFSLRNTSTVDFGSITKLQWFIDGNKESEDLDPVPNKVYDFNYPQFTSPISKSLTIKMVVYSGGTCRDEVVQQVVLFASPVVKFNELTSVCVNSGTIQFVGSEIGGLQGTAAYTGVGTSLSGLFNPKLAGIGLHKITYTFTSLDGCVDEKTQDIEVYPIPKVYAGADFYILAGGQQQMEATATGNGLTYQWSPSIGLSRTDILNPIAMPEKDTKYTLTVTSAQNCATSSQVYVNVLQDVNAPNTFTPNGDGINDVWNIKYLSSYPNSSVEIFDRNGQRIYYSSKGYAVPFDGNYKNQQLPIGSYYYIINPNSGRKSITGNLTIIR